MYSSCECCSDATSNMCGLNIILFSKDWLHCFRSFFSLFFFLYVFNDFRKKGIYEYFLHGNQKNLSFTIWGFAREMSRSELDCTLVTNPMNPKLCECPLPGFVGISGVNMGEQPTIGWFCWDNYSIIIIYIYRLVHPVCWNS